MRLLASLVYAVCILFCCSVGVGIVWLLWTIFKPEVKHER